jgi:hypothetical protein
MAAAVIDTNVLLVANGSHENVSPACQAECVRRLLAQQQSGVTVIDDAHAILSEYLNKTKPNQPKGVGDVFLKWLLSNKGNTARVHRVTLTETAQDTYSEFPDAALQPQFDAADRKFAAVAYAHSERPPIWQAADCKWLDWWPALQNNGVSVVFLCPDDVCRAYRKKFPKRPKPALPEA